MFLSFPCYLARVPLLTSESLQGLPRNGETDPIEYYRRPLVGYLFRERINMGLRMLGDRRWPRALEVGYGAGAVLVSLAPVVDELVGLDLDADPDIVTRALRERGMQADLRKGSVYELPYEDASFDLVVSFSVFEHLHEYERGLREVRRVLRADGTFLLGMPAVSRAMTKLFLAIGYSGIDEHHVTTPADVRRRFARAGFTIERTKNLGLPGRMPALYYTWLLRAV